MKISIGSENKVKELDNCSIVTASYGTKNNMLGSIGIIGPTHMDYHKNVSIIQNTANILSKELNILIDI